MSRLSERLNRLKQQAPRSKQSTATPDYASAEQHFGNEKDTVNSEVETGSHSESISEQWMKNRGWNLLAPGTWIKTIKKELTTEFKEQNSFFIPQGYTKNDLIFYDTETTGLSGGAGTVAFLTGIGRFSGNTLEITQIFLSDYTGEPEALHHLKTLIPDSALAVSYNGKSFDAPLLRTRFIMNGLESTQPEQLDLLYPCRRLYRRVLENCSLSTIEDQILEIKRELDIPGSEVPEIWFRFLKEGPGNDLNRVFHHHVQDIFSLALLLTHLEQLTSGKILPVREDLFSLGLLYINHEEQEKGLELIRSGWKSGDEKCGRWLSLYHKRRKEWDQALKIWNTLKEDSFSLLERAKDLEHRRKSPEEALKLVDKLIINSEHRTLRFRENLLHRKQRLIMKKRFMAEQVS